MILAGDIGGTKTLLALFSATSGDCVAKQHYSSADFKSFYDLLDSFLAEQSTPELATVCLGVAGPVVEGNCVTTNLPWILRADDIKTRTGARHVALLNDLEAMSWGLLNMPEADFIALNPDAEQTTGHIAVLAAGTGLGEAIIVRDKAHTTVLSTEGGHTDFAPTDELEFKLFTFLQQKYGHHISYERVVSGMGIVDIYDFLKQQTNMPATTETEQRFKREDKAAVISQQAQAKHDPLCVETMRIFCRCYGAEASNLALKTLSYGGVLLAGGIAAKNLNLMTDGVFMQAFLDKGRYHALLKKIPVKICLNAEAALLGAFYYALTR